MNSLFLKEVTADISLYLKDGNQKNDMCNLFSQPTENITLGRGWIEINQGILRWKTYCSSFENEDAFLRFTPKTLCLYIGNDCRAEYPWQSIKDIKLCCASIFSHEKTLVHHIQWKEK